MPPSPGRPPCLWQFLSIQDQLVSLHQQHALRRGCGLRGTGALVTLLASGGVHPLAASRRRVPSAAGHPSAHSGISQQPPGRSHASGSGYSPELDALPVLGIQPWPGGPACPLPQHSYRHAQGLPEVVPAGPGRHVESERSVSRGRSALHVPLWPAQPECGLQGPPSLRPGVPRCGAFPQACCG